MPRDPARQLLAAYPVLHHALKQRAITVGSNATVSPHQATVLGHLDRAQAQTLSELAGAIGVALPTMSLLVERLVAGGLIRRERDQNDGRRVALRLTPAGERVAQTASLLDPDRVRLLLASMSPAERNASVAGVITLALAARKLPPAGRQPGGKAGA